MSKPQSSQKRWSWIMGGMALVVSLFFPPFWRPFSGAFWALLFSYPHSVTPLVSQVTQMVCLFFPSCTLIASIVWLWSRQINGHPTISRAFMVTLEAIVIAFLATVVFAIMVFVILDTGGWYATTVFPMESRGWYDAALFSLVFGLDFLVFFPCLLIAATALVYLQRKARQSDMAASIDVRSGSGVVES